MVVIDFRSIEKHVKSNFDQVPCSEMSCLVVETHCKSTGYFLLLGLESICRLPLAGTGHVINSSSVSSMTRHLV